MKRSLKLKNAVVFRQTEYFCFLNFYFKILYSYWQKNKPNKFN